jgi:hypothetical protein
MTPNSELTAAQAKPSVVLCLASTFEGFL